MKQKIIFSEHTTNDLAAEIAESRADHVFFLTDENTRKQCWPLVTCEKKWAFPVAYQFAPIFSAKPIVIPAGEAHKNLESVAHVWDALQRRGATRHSLLVNIGGGMVTDLGGFAASTFKRGMAFINIPTTLLSMVDASVGGKTGVNFGGLKNEIGVFSEPQAVIIDPRFLATLDRENLLSGYAEMLKHGLLDTVEHWAELLASDSSLQFSAILKKSIAVKERIVAADPREKGLRKALNLGHTFGHAFEEWSFERSSGVQEFGSSDHRPLLHGYAVALGLICELYLSAVKCGFPTEKMRQTVQFIREHYQTDFRFTCNDYPELIRLMRHDKKNVGEAINFTLLADIGDIRLDQTATDAEISEALDFLREG